MPPKHSDVTPAYDEVALTGRDRPERIQGEWFR